MASVHPELKYYAGPSSHSSTIDPRRRAWSPSPATLTSPNSFKILVSAPVTSSTNSNHRYLATTVRQLSSSSPLSLSPPSSSSSSSPIALNCAAKTTVLSQRTFVYGIIEYVPTFAWLATNKKIANLIGQIIYDNFLAPYGLKEITPHSNDGQPDYLSIWKHLSRYTELMKNEYAKIFPLFIQTDYTSRMLKQTVPFEMPSLPTNPLNYLFYINWNGGFEQRNRKYKDHLRTSTYLKEEVNKINYFIRSISLSPIDDPRFFSRFLRYIFDQIYYLASQEASIYPKKLYARANKIFEKDEYLSYEDWHYVLLIHIHTVLTRTFLDSDKINLIHLMLTKIKLKNTDLTKLKRQLQILLSPTQQTERMATLMMNNIMRNQKKTLNLAYIEANYEGVLGIVKKYFPNFVSKTTGCVIS